MDTKTMIPISTGIYVKAEASETNTMYFNQARKKIMLHIS